MVWETFKCAYAISMIDIFTQAEDRTHLAHITSHSNERSLTSRSARNTNMLHLLNVLQAVLTYDLVYCVGTSCI